MIVKRNARSKFIRSEDYWAISIGFSLMLGYLPSELGRITVEQGMLRGFTVEVWEWMFCLAFASIGLSTNFRELRAYFSGGKPLILYVCGRTFNLVLTLIMAWLMFNVVFTGFAPQW